MSGKFEVLENPDEQMVVGFAKRMELAVVKIFSQIRNRVTYKSE